MLLATSTRESICVTEWLSVSCTINEEFPAQSARRKKMFFFCYSVLFSVSVLFFMIFFFFSVDGREWLNEMKTRKRAEKATEMDTAR